MLVYTVTCALPSEEECERYLGWLEDDHLADVVRAGAVSGEAVRLDGEGVVVETRYRFASREAFAAYERGPAEALRAEGREKFGPETGVTFTRSVGEVRVARGG